MGADHARSGGRPVLVSIFVNPTQFGPGEDIDRYPRQLDDDLALCERMGADGVFCPSATEMYPPDVPACDVAVPQLANLLEGKHRPGHLNGVCRVVAKLFNIIQPGLAIFGFKDYQQLRVIQAMVADLEMPIEVTACPTVREADGLALSSRNTYLTPPQRKRAISLYKALETAKVLIEQNGESDAHVVELAMAAAMSAHHIEVDYAAIRHPHTLVPMDCIEPGLTGGVVALVAGRVDGCRLIDSMLIGVAKQGSKPAG